MRPDAIAVALWLAVADVRNELERRIKMGEDWLGRGDRLLDELERAIDDLDDARFRRQLRSLVVLLDEHRMTVATALAGISSHDLWDPLRALATDVQDDL